MSSSDHSSFNDPSAFAQSIRAATVDLTPTGAGSFQATRTQIALGDVWMQRLSTNLPWVKHTACSPARAIITFLAEPGTSVTTHGEPMPFNAIARHSTAEEYYEHSDGPASWCTMSLPVEKLAALGAAITGVDLPMPSDMQLVTPHPAAMSNLRLLHASGVRFAAESPGTIKTYEPAHALEQSLLEAMMACLGGESNGEDRRSRRYHKAIMLRFYRHLSEWNDRPCYVPEICMAIGTTERTLQFCCQEHLGMSPNRYLTLRRMHLARRAIQAADPDQETVADIASRFGFWHAGRFAGAFRSLFGEYPSVTLGRSGFQGS